MKNKIIWLRISYWVGIVADALAALRMVFPKIDHGPEYRYALGLGASLMLGWTFLLFWGDRKPVERKGVLILTVFPVISGLLMAQIYAAFSGVYTFEQVRPTVVLLAGIAGLMSFGYFKAGK